MLALIDYGFIIVFFVGLFVLVLVIARPRPEAVAAQGTVTSHIAASPGTKEDIIRFDCRSLCPVSYRNGSQPERACTGREAFVIDNFYRA